MCKYIVVRSAEFLKRTRFADVFLLRRFGEISNEAGGHLSRLYLILAVWHFCGQGDFFIDCNF